MLRALQQPSYIDGLMESLVKSLNVVPEDALPLYWNELPAAMQELAREARKAGRSSCCWMLPGLHVWLFIGEMSLPLSRERGAPVLQLWYYRETGLIQTGHWFVDRRAHWHSCCLE